MSNFRKFISMSAVAILGATNLLTSLTYAQDAAKPYDSLTSADLEKPALRFIMPNKDVYLYAITEPNKYFVEYHGNTHTSWTMTGSEFTYDTTWDLKANAFAKTWYTFTGWNTKTGGNWTSYVDKAKVFNWTTEESGTVDIYAQWKANSYNINYDLNKWSGSSTPTHNEPHPGSLNYDQTWTVTNPDRVWYDFSGWTITNMDSESHIVGWQASNKTSETGVKWEIFKNLLATSGTVNFKAIWSPKQVPYTVEHYLQNLSGTSYVIQSGDTQHLTWTADTEVRPATGNYTWFKPNSDTPYSGNVEPDGSQVFKYNYDRQSYDLTITAGRWIASVKWIGTVNTAGGSANSGQSKTISFKYEEPVKLSFVLKDWYENGEWSGYQDTASGFNMPAANISKTAYAKPIVYNLTVNCVWGNNCTPSGTYTVESDSIPLNTPDRVHSEFAWWTGTNIVWTAATVSIPSGSTWHRTYTATWTCHDWYHDTNVDGGSCQPDANTEYTVRHYLQDLSGGYTILTDTVIQTWTTDTVTSGRANTYVWFELANIATWIIKWDKSTKIDITYNRLNYTGSVDATTWVTVTHVWANDGKNGATSGHHQYDDVVTIKATTWAGYTFSGWTITDAGGHDITNQLLSGNEITSTTATFNMPASGITIKANVKTNEYRLTIISHWGANGSTGRTYTVEDTVKLVNPTRDHSDFAWWSWTDLSEPTMHVEFSGRAKDSVYEETWKCHTWYHASGANECVANEYNVVVVDGDGTHGSAEPVVFTYDKTETLPKAPAQSWYDFVWWTITWMSGWVEHYIGDVVTSGDTYVYSGTSIEFKNLTVVSGGTVTITAIWEARNDTPYKVYHYYQNTGNNNYTLSGTAVEYSWTTDKPINLNNVMENTFGFHNHAGTWTSEAYTWWSVNGPEWTAKTEITIDKHGNTVIYFYYDRNMWNVHLSGDAHVATLSGAGAYKYGADVTVSATAKTWYHFKTWKRKTDNTFKTDL